MTSASGSVTTDDTTTFKLISMGHTHMSTCASSNVAFMASLGLLRDVAMNTPGAICGMNNPGVVFGPTSYNMFKLLYIVEYGSIFTIKELSFLCNLVDVYPQAYMCCSSNEIPAMYNTASVLENITLLRYAEPAVFEAVSTPTVQELSDQLTDVFGLEVEEASSGEVSSVEDA